MATLSRIAPEIPVTNLQESIEFYQHRLGFQVAAVMPDHEYAIVERDAIAIHLFADGGGSHARVAMHIFTQELDQLHEEFSTARRAGDAGNHPQALGQSRLSIERRFRE